ncbi:GxxExxY protein [Hymenobacter nivis]|nr:GxxExxY protein [Hymenobacter nivis]
MTVHCKLGLGFPEVVYQRALAIELFKQGLKAEREAELSIYTAHEVECENEVGCGACPRPSLNGSVDFRSTTGGDKPRTLLRDEYTMATKKSAPAEPTFSLMGGYWLK